MSLYKRYNLASRRSRGETALAWAGCAALLLAGVGCNSTDKKKDDPLFGVKPPTVSPVPPTTGNTGAQSRAAVPPIPGSTSAASTAALASLPGGRALSIQTQGATVPGSPNPSSTPQVQPIPRETPTVPGVLATGSWTAPASANVASTGDSFGDPQFALLQARGASAKKVDNVPEGVRLTVFVPNRENPASERILVATERDYPTAVQAILRQLEQQR